MTDKPGMTAERLQEIEQRAEKATKGPWACATNLGCKSIGPKRGELRKKIRSVVTTDGVEEKEDKANAKFIAHARQDIPALARALRSAWDELELALSPIVRCHRCKGALMWSRNETGIEVYHDCASGLHAMKERAEQAEAELGRLRAGQQPDKWAELCLSLGLDSREETAESMFNRLSEREQVKAALRSSQGTEPAPATLDEMCECGEPKSKHTPFVRPMAHKPLGIEPNGWFCPESPVSSRLRTFKPAEPGTEPAGESRPPNDWQALAAFTSLTTGMPYFPGPAPQESAGPTCPRCKETISGLTGCGRCHPENTAATNAQPVSGVASDRPVCCGKPMLRRVGFKGSSAFKGWKCSVCERVVEAVASAPKCMNCGLPIMRCDGSVGYCGCRGWFHIDTGKGPSHKCADGNTCVAEPEPTPEEAAEFRGRCGVASAPGDPEPEEDGDYSDTSTVGIAKLAEQMNAKLSERPTPASPEMEPKCRKHPNATPRLAPKHREHWPDEWCCPECEKETGKVSPILTELSTPEMEMRNLLEKYEDAYVDWLTSNSKASFDHRRDELLSRLEELAILRRHRAATKEERNG